MLAKLGRWAAKWTFWASALYLAVTLVFFPVLEEPFRVVILLAFMAPYPILQFRGGLRGARGAPDADVEADG